MAARTNSDKAASSDAVEITSIPADDIAEIIAAQAPAPEVETLDNGTLRSTNTVYEDRTGNPVDDSDREYEVEESKLPGGTTIRTYGEPVGGFPVAE